MGNILERIKPKFAEPYESVLIGSYKTDNLLNALKNCFLLCS